ncbi:dUTPase [Fictibacillus aquaticus]|uniref:dUTPase n=2 Tax=Fictibacillus aquaticus TaxID=2021314 RepID=A0A235FAE2_9BACL|nr:dUTPase [Fictibacillus aquaticus]
MDVKKLLYMQRQLNERIVREHTLNNEELYNKRLLAFLVELGELANETRSFKYWSTKGPSPDEVILEEYVDGLHFVLSICLDLGAEELQVPLEKLEQEDSDSITSRFITLCRQASSLADDRKRERVMLLFEEYLLLGQALGFTFSQIEEGYLKKNEVNHTRQDSGY